MSALPDASSLILHQYEISPFSEKVRVALGIKQLTWFACNQPVIMPKDELVALTGGYRRIPVLQIGADFYFDTVLIIEEIERRFPANPVFTGSGAGMTAALALWTDDALFMTAVGLLFGGDWDYDDAFLADRSQLLGRNFDPAEMAAAATSLVPRMLQFLALLERQLADGRAFLFGPRPDAVDAGVYAQIIFMRWGKGRTAALLDGFAHVLAWEKRVAAIGHGQRGEISRQAAIDLAAAAKPVAVTEPNAKLPGDPSPGEMVKVHYHDASTPPLEAVLMGISARQVSVAPPGTGRLLHMPRSTARIMPA